MQIKPRTITKIVFRSTQWHEEKHHIYDNNGTYWIYYNAHYSGSIIEKTRSYPFNTRFWNA